MSKCSHGNCVTQPNYLINLFSNFNIIYCYLKTLPLPKLLLQPYYYPTIVSSLTAAALVTLSFAYVVFGMVTLFGNTFFCICCLWEWYHFLVTLSFCIYCLWLISNCYCLTLLLSIPYSASTICVNTWNTLHNFVASVLPHITFCPNHLYTSWASSCSTKSSSIHFHIMFVFVESHARQITATTAINTPLY